MKKLLFTLTPKRAALGLALGAALLPASPALAQQTPPPTSLAAPVPTTHVLAIGTLVEGHTPQSIRAIMPDEVRDTVGLYLSGRIEQWWVQKEKQGVIFLLNATSADDARALLADLPLVKGGILRFDLIPLGPLKPLQYLTDAGAR
ncbi:MAG: hypothetical protein ACO1NM_12510 [Sphingobium phenoxybenzoativorans]